MTPCRASPTVWTRRSRRSGRVPHTSYELCNIRLSGLLSGVWDNFHDQLLWAAVITSHREAIGGGRASSVCQRDVHGPPWENARPGAPKKKAEAKKETVAKVKRGA